MSSRSTNIRSLQIQVQNQKVLSESGHYFLPDVEVAKIFKLSAIKDAISELDFQPDEQIGLAEEIHSKGTKTFAILVLMSEERLIVKFRNYKALDDSLPLSEDDARKVAGDVGGFFAKEYQWQLLPETLPSNMWRHHLEIAKEKILPFASEPEQLNSGTYGEISKVGIYSSQQELCSPKGVYVYIIRKQLRSKEMTEELRRERLCLRLLNLLKHPNIIRLLGSYTHQGRHNFLFPCIDMDMEAFLGKADRFGDFVYDFTFFSALHGLSSALLNTHCLHLDRAEHGIDFDAIGYHHDIRPANILVSKETFILADFGLGNIKPADVQSHTPFKVTTGDWLAPECMAEQHDRQDVNRAIDIWAFGCLIAEVVTYMRKGDIGVKKFSDRRKSPGRKPRWEDHYFYNHNGEVKSEVQKWLTGLADDKSSENFITPLCNLSLAILIEDPQKRPSILNVCEQLAVLSFRAHFLATRMKFTRHAKLDATSMAHDALIAKNFWILQERFCAWGTALEFEGEKIAPEAIGTMVALFHALDKGPPETKDNDERYMFEKQIDKLIEVLWGLLSPNLRRRAEDYWHQAILNTENSKDLEAIHHVSSYAVYSVVDAMAKMRKMRLDALRPNSFIPLEKAHTIASSDLEKLSTENGHILGRYKGKEMVMLERIRYTSALEALNSVQMDAIMDLKAKSLNQKPKPEGLRTLECIGVLKETSHRDGYQFVYRYPASVSPEFATLLQQINQSKRSNYRPLLGDKFQLAFALANFLKEFHTIGWLHENFNSHNVLLFKSPNIDNNNASPMTFNIQRPCIVGLHKSRPDGSFWQTDGPASDIELQSYQHPKYASTGRYQLAFDYYSLGIVLLEVGLWRPLHYLIRKYSSCSLAEIRLQLQEQCQSELGAKMGGVYRDVVLQCIDGSLESGPVSRDERHTDRAAALQSFILEVVDPLDRLSNALI